MAQTKVKDGLLNFPDRDDFIQLPSGTTAQRPSSPEQGYSRYNTTDNKIEYWNGTIWQQLPGVVAPIITSLSYPGDDLAADPAGGQTITINGGDFKAGATVTVGGTTPSVITFVSATQITFEAPAKAAGDYNVVVTNVDGGNATSVDGMSYNGVPSWTTAAGNLGTFPAGSTIPTITLVATEPDSGTISYSVTTGALPTGLTLTGADIDGSVPTPAGETTYNFSVTASDDENQESTERAFNIVVYIQVTNTVSEVDPFGDSSGVALYRLENNANDEGGVYNGTPTNVTYGTGVFGQAGVFNGASSKVVSSAFISGNAERTLSVWYKTTSADGILLSLGPTTSPANNNEHFAIAPASSNTLNIYGYNGPGPVVDELMSGFSTNLLSGQWTNIIVTWDGQVGGTLKAYINGALESTLIRSAGKAYNTAAGFQIGTWISGNRFLNGQVDQTRIFNKALTPLEVQSLYQERVVLCGGQAETVDILGDNSCIALYPLDGNANDLSGNYSGTPTDVSYGVGEFDLAGVFNGSSSYVDLPTSVIPTNDFSFSFWFKANSIPADVRFLFSHEATSNNRGISLYFENSKIGFKYSNGTNKIIVWNTVPSTNTWYNAVGTLGSSSGGDLYINGVSVGSETYIALDLANHTECQIGGRSWNSTLFFNGSIDQVRIFNKALSSSEVTTLYNETACDSALKPCADKFLDGSGISLYELDSNGLDFNGLYNLYGQNVSYSAGRFNDAAVFNGSNSYFRGINPLYGFNGASNYSVSAWFKADSFSKQYPVIFKSINNDTGQGPPFVWTDGGMIRFHGYYYGDYVATISTGVWHHVVLVNEGTTIKGYFNGSQVSLSGITQWGAKNGENFVLGADYDSISSTAFDGQIDQVRVFRKALTSAEVTTLYNETACN